MINEYVVKAPSAFLYETPALSAEVTDEVLFGTRLFAISEPEEKQDWLSVETSYGYRGFVRKKHIYRKIGFKVCESFVVTSAFCDVLPVPEYRYKPVMTLPRGSFLEKNTGFGNVCGFTDVNIFGKRFFVRAENLKNTCEINENKQNSVRRKNIVDTALSYLDTPYRWGGKSPSGIDCSGLCFQSYALNGLSLWRDAVPDGKYVRQIAFDELCPADLVYYKGHMVLYIGDGEYIHACATKGKVCINSFDKNSPLFYPKLEEGIIMCARSVEL